MIDGSDKRCQFQAITFDTGAQVEWLVDNALPGVVGPWFLYQAPATVRLPSSPSGPAARVSPGVFDEAKFRSSTTTGRASRTPAAGSGGTDGTISKSSKSRDIDPLDINLLADDQIP